MAGYKVEICGVNTAELPLLKAKEKEELLKKIKQGDANAREQFIKGNLRLVLSIVQRFNQSNENIDDLFQIGCIGMIKAIDNFDLSQNVQFSTYAVPMILGEIKRYLRDNNSIRVSRSMRDTAYKAIYTKEKLTKLRQKNRQLMKLRPKSVCQKKISYLHWRQYKHLSRCTNLYTMMAATHSMCSTRSVTKRTAKKTGSAGFLLKKQLKNSPHARKKL